MVDTLVVTLCADEYRPPSDPADALAEIWIGQDDGPHLVYIQATPGQAQAVVFTGSWPLPATVSVWFKNDAWGGTAATDRNLYLLGCTYNGQFFPPPQSNTMMISNTDVAITIPAPPPPPPIVVAGSTTTPPPTGMSGTFVPVLDATFGTSVAGATIKNRATLFQDANCYPWYIYGPAATNPSRPGPAGTTYEILGPQGNGTDGLYGNYRSRHAHFAPDSPQDVHLLGPDRLTLRAWCGIANGNPNDATDPNVVSGILRFIPQFKPGSAFEIKCKMPKGMYSWPAFWLNTGVQAGWQAGNIPGAVQIANWNAEIDIFDQFGFNNTPPGHYLIAGDPTPENAAAYALPGQTGPTDLPPTFTNIPGLVTWPNGWYATTDADLTEDFHVFGLDWRTDNTLAFYLDGQNYRTRGYVWPADAPPAHLIASLQVGAYFNNLTAMTPQGDAWNWDIMYIRAWNRTA
jgi:hypothetical protein